MTTKKELYFKVLNGNMESCNGGTQKWQINKRVTVKGKTEMCKHGIHLTLQPTAWQGSRVFIAETSTARDFQEDGMKIVCQSATLLMELPSLLLKAYEEGEAPFLKAYKEGCQKILQKILEGES